MCEVKVILFSVVFFFFFSERKIFNIPCLKGFGEALEVEKVLSFTRQKTCNLNLHTSLDSPSLKQLEQK